MKKPRKKQAFTSGPKDISGAAAPNGKRASTNGHRMGGMFGKVTAKKPEVDNRPRTRAQERQLLRARLGNKLI